MDELTLSIGDLARRTGVDIPTLRRWERYDGLLTPTRTPGGQRRYGAADVAAVLELVALIGKGWATESAARAVADHRDTGAIVFDASLLDAVPTGVVVTNASNQVLYANPAIAGLLGLTPAEVEAAGGADFLDDEERGRVAAAFERMREGEPQAFDVRMRTRAGGHVDVEVTAGPLLGADGVYRGVVGVFHDLTRTRRAEERAELLTRLVDATDEAVLAVGTDLRVTAWNGAALRMAAADLDAECGLFDVLPEELAAPTAAAVRRAIEGEASTFEIRSRNPEGDAMPLEKQVRVLPVAPAVAGAAAVVVAVDIVSEPEPLRDDGTSTAYHGVVAALTQSVLAGDEPAAILDTAVQGIGRALGASHVTFVELRRPTNEVAVLASTVDEPSSYPPSAPFGSHVGFAVQSQRPIAVTDFDAERRFDRGPLAGEQAARSGLCVPVRWRPDGSGALSVHSADERRDFGPAEVTFFQSVANVCALALQGKDGVTTEERP